MLRTSFLLASLLLLGSSLCTDVYIVTEVLSLGLSIDSQFFYINIKDKGIQDDIYIGFGDDFCQGTDYVKFSQLNSTGKTPYLTDMHCTEGSMKEDTSQDWQLYSFNNETGVYVVRRALQAMDSLYEDAELRENIDNDVHLVYSYKEKGAEETKGTFLIPYPRLERIKKILNESPYLSLEIWERKPEFHWIIESDFKGFTWIGIGNSLEGADIAFIGEDPLKANKKNKTFVIFLHWGFEF
jgi:hypothetical protein